MIRFISLSVCNFQVFSGLEAVDVIIVNPAFIQPSLDEKERCNKFNCPSLTSEIEIYTNPNIFFIMIIRIGRSIAIELWRAGAQVVAVSRTKSHLDSLHHEYPAIQIVSVDLGNWDAARKAIDQLGHFDALVNNAAVGLTEDFLTTTPENFDLLMNVNVKAMLNVSQVVAKKMIDAKKGGAIVNISSQASKAALWGHATYCASKGAVDALTRVMALELGPHNIRVNTVNPTVIMTEMGKLGWSDPAKAAGMLAKIPLGRFGEVSEVVNAVLFLLSDKASMINGVELPIDGGFLAC